MKTTTSVCPSPKGEITQITLTNASGASVTLSTLGAGITSIIVPDPAGNMADVVLGYDNPADYIADGPCAGKTPGRYANRIAGGHLVVGGKSYSLPINNGPNHLHGGPDGFQNQNWAYRLTPDGCGVEFSLTSPDGHMGYPAKLHAAVTYRWTDRNELSVNYKATAEGGDTVANLTNHSYFNLSGHSSGSALKHQLTLQAHRYLPTDPSLIPTGELAPVQGTPMDFTEPKEIGADIQADFPALKYGKGYDNCWMIDGYDGSMRLAASLTDTSGRHLDVFTDQPGIQVYTGNWLAGSPSGKGGYDYKDYDCVALECQGLPDAPNKPEFPSQLVRDGQTLERNICFSFSA